jgi:predicted restriction endonuclease
MREDGLYDLLKRIAALKRAPKTTRGRYPAGESPYKPVLLLTVLRRIQQGKNPYALNRIDFDSCTRDFGHVYGRLFGNPEEMMPKVTQAFWYLGSGVPKIWSFVPKSGYEENLDQLMKDHAQIKSPGKLDNHIEYAYFAEEDFRLVNDGDVQEALISFLISRHFADPRAEIALL